ncbi:LysR family transcriptional regulator [Pseudomonas chlororaphis]|uniref:LysR family transcriptional regulator n=1 Tax=Pseudomonas chlororaphis TaxID=587753 RepID=A0A1Q8EWA3_9PSED|nr:LysR family transcriptional regulator [Pseudomonas chlororaphis]OLF56074.1 LysR family transcriptional regulator [Pseudomonas chlororaphis]
MTDWQDLHHFIVVARLGSLTAAAKALRVDHATVGRRVSSLEASLGLKLLERLPRASRLTEAGAVLAAIAQPMERLVDEVERHARGSVGLSGTVSVSTLALLASGLLVPSLATLRATCPDLKIVLDTTSSVASLERGEADIALGYVRPDEAGRIVRRVGQVRFGFYASPAYAALAPADWTFIGFAESLEHIPQQRWLQEFAAQRPFILRSNDVNAQQAAARAAVGVALLPCFIANPDPGLVRVAPLRAGDARELWLSVHADVRRSAAVRRVMDHLIEVLASRLE